MTDDAARNKNESLNPDFTLVSEKRCKQGR